MQSDRWPEKRPCCCMSRAKPCKIQSRQDSINQHSKRRGIGPARRGKPDQCHSSDTRDLAPRSGHICTKQHFGGDARSKQRPRPMSASPMAANNRTLSIHLALAALAHTRGFRRIFGFVVGRSKTASCANFWTIMASAPVRFSRGWHRRTRPKATDYTFRVIFFLRATHAGQTGRARRKS